MKFIISLFVIASFSTLLFADNDWGCGEGDGKFSSPTKEVPTMIVRL